MGSTKHWAWRQQESAYFPPNARKTKACVLQRQEHFKFSACSGSFGIGLDSWAEGMAPRHPHLLGTGDLLDERDSVPDWLAQGDFFGTLAKWVGLGVST